MADNCLDIQFFKVTELPTVGVPDSVYWLLNGGSVVQYVTDKQGNLLSSPGFVETLTALNKVGSSITYLDETGNTEIINFANVAFSGSYTDLINKITNTSELNNDGDGVNNFATVDQIPTTLGDLTLDVAIGSSLAFDATFAYVLNLRDQNLNVMSQVEITPTNIKNLDQYLGFDFRYYTKTQISDFFSGNTAITGYNRANWNEAYSWGNHALAGYLTAFSEDDPVFTGSPAGGITASNITNWNLAFGWGDHSTVGYLTSFTETDPVFTASSAASITASDITNWDSAFDSIVTAASFNPTNGDLTLTRPGTTNLVTSFDGRYSIAGHVHPISDITGLQSTLDNLVTINTAQTITGQKTFTQNVIAPGYTTPSGTRNEFLNADGSTSVLYDGVDLEANILALNPTLYLGEVWWASDTKKTIKAVSSTIGGTDVWQKVALNYDETKDSFALETTVDGQTLNLGQETFMTVYNDNDGGATQLDPKLFVVTSVKAGEENVKNVVLANGNDLFEESIYGLNTNSCQPGEYSKITVYGDVNNVNTSAWLPGTILYVGSTPGELTNVKPSTKIFPVAKVLKQDALDGKLFVNTLGLRQSLTTVLPSSFDRIHYTADEVTLATGTYAIGNRNNQGTLGSLTSTVLVADNTIAALPKQIIGSSPGFPITFKAGIFKGQIEYEVDNGGGENRIYLEYYKAEADGTAVDSGITAEPIGVLGVRPALRAVSNLYSPALNVRTYAEFQGQLTEDISLTATQRVRVVILCEKVGTQGPSITFTVYFGNLHASYTDSPALFRISDNIDVDTAGSVTNDVLTKSADGVWRGTPLVGDDEIYSSAWDASLEVPTKNAIYDKIESLVTGGADKTFTFVQGVPATTWSINHNLGKFPSVTIVNSANEVVIGDVEYIDNNNLTATFTGAFSGRAELN